MNTLVNEGVGKRIVEALKKQSELEFTNQLTDANEQEVVNNAEPVNSLPQQDTIPFSNPNQFVSQPVNSTNLSLNMQSQTAGIGFNMNNNMNNINNNINNNSQMFSQNVFSELNGQEVPANVMILKQLVAQLPSGVSRQAGALIIKQTMEALGISMKTVLQEAQQMQERINISARECQNSILECKKQINTLEAQVQQYQRQSASLNDIVSLFLQLN